MSLTPTAPPVGGLAPGPRRVRHQARDVVALMAFSATTSVAVAVGLLLLAHLAREVVVIGALNRVEIWDPTRIAAWEEEHSQAFAEMSEDVFPG